MQSTIKKYSASWVKALAMALAFLFVFSTMLFPVKGETFAADAVTVSDAAGFEAALKGASPITINITGDFTITSTTTISSDVNLTINGGGHTITQSGGAQTLHMTGTGTTVSINGLTIDGAGSKTTDAKGGSAIYVEGGAVTIENSVIKNCETTASSSGGAVIQRGGTLNLTNCSFIGNKAVNYGGAISSEGAKVYATNCTFYNNSS
ncbi:MAG: hypothetical protein LBC58_05570, partial [Clostridiales Family XIII bacterium]|nr:hypothetical protein [Clostridiales Family XIII bacterium]